MSPARRSKQHKQMFQSLFSWNLPSDIAGGISCAGCPRRFNPCFLGTCPRMVWLQLTEKGMCLFQSLFSWNLPSDLLAFFAPRAQSRVSILVFLELALGSGRESVLIGYCRCFNPCFLGTCPRIRPGVGADRILPMFQSLFSWNLPSDGIRAKRTETELSVSILVFLELALGLGCGTLHPLRVLGFNPCFLGTCPRMRYVQEGPERTLHVSILVFLELALGSLQ